MIRADAQEFEAAAAPNGSGTCATALEQCLAGPGTLLKKQWHTVSGTRPHRQCHPPASSYTFESTPTSISLPAGSLPKRVVVANVDGDSDLDIVATLQPTGTPLPAGQVAIIVNSSTPGNRSFAAPVYENLVDAGSNPVFGPVGLAAADFNGDTTVDIAAAGYQDEASPKAALAVLWKDPSTGGYAKRAQLPDSDQAGKGHDLTVLPQDPNKIAISNSVGSFIHVFTVTGAGFPPGLNGISRPTVRQGQQPSHSKPISAFRLQETDSVWHIAIANRESTSLNAPKLRWYQQNAGAFDLQEITYPSAKVGIALATGRVSKNNTFPVALDSRADLVLTANETNDGADRQFEVFRNTGSTGSLFASVSFPVSPNPFDRPFPVHVIVFDMNADGFPDVLTANRGLVGLDPVGSQFEGFSLQLNRQ